MDFFFAQPLILSKKMSEKMACPRKDSIESIDDIAAATGGVCGGRGADIPYSLVVT